MPGLFISHSSLDKPFVLRLAVELLNRGFPVWLDTWELGLGDSLLDRIYGAIDESSYLLLVMSPAAATSGWVEKEINAALVREDQLGRRFLLPIKAADCQIPLKVADRLYADFSRSFLTGVEMLEVALKKLGINRLRMPNERVVVPLLFRKGAFLVTEALRQRLDVLEERHPDVTKIEASQVVALTDETYDVLRRKMVTRFENIEADKYFTPDFARSFGHYYNDVRQDEDALCEGMALLLSLRLKRTQLLFDPLEAGEWYARLVRGRILSSLWTTQNPDDEPDPLLKYGREWGCSALVSNGQAAEFFGVEAVELVTIIPDRDVHGSSAFSVWIGSDSSTINALRLNGIFLGPVALADVCPGSELSKYVVPQMLWRHLVAENAPLVWDLENAQIGIA